MCFFFSALFLLPSVEVPPLPAASERRLSHLRAGRHPEERARGCSKAGILRAGEDGEEERMGCGSWVGARGEQPCAHEVPQDIGDGRISLLFS